MKKSNSGSKFMLLIPIFVLLQLLFGMITMWDEIKLNKIAHEAIVNFNNENFSKAEESIEKGDKIYARANFLSKLTLIGGSCHSYVNTSNTVKGRFALKENELELAKSYLMKSAMVESTPTLSSFGPNMSLANDLLKINEKEIVIKYLDECKRFWEHDSGRIEKWKGQIVSEQFPDFGGNLIY